MGAGDEGGTEELGADDRRVEGRGEGIKRPKGAGKGNTTRRGSTRGWARKGAPGVESFLSGKT